MHTRFSRPGRAVAVTVGAVLSTLALAGCSHNEPQPPTIVNAPPPAAPAPIVTTTTPVAATPDTKINTNAGPGTSNGTDTALADTINTAIVHNKQMTGSRVEVVATSSVVTLTGSVQNGQQKALAETTASKTPGVASVKNKLIIVTTGGAKPKPVVITKTKTIVVHDKSAPDAAPADTTGTDSGQAPASPAPPTSPAPPAAPNAPNPPAPSGNP